MSASGWIGVDFDGTLSHYSGWNGGVLGEPIGPMLFRIKKWMADGVEVRIVTARASQPELIAPIEAWLEQHGIGGCKVTDKKDFMMIELWDDRAVAVETNTGRVLGGGRR